MTKKAWGVMGPKGDMVSNPNATWRLFPTRVLAAGVAKRVKGKVVRVELSAP